MPRFTIKQTMIGVAVLGLLMGAFTLIPRRKTVIEELDNPRRVIGWNSAGLILEDGRRIRLPMIRVLPDRSAILAEATARGVEVARDGRVIGLMPCRHWCGNDPIRQHIARVDLSDLMIYRKEAKVVLPQEMDSFEWTGENNDWRLWGPGEFAELQIFGENLRRSVEAR